MKTHDAELCERIRLLEERVRELEARPTYSYQPPHYCYWGCPIHYGTTTWPQWTWTVTNGTTTGSNSTLSIGDPS